MRNIKHEEIWTLDKIQKSKSSVVKSSDDFEKDFWILIALGCVYQIWKEHHFQSCSFEKWWRSANDDGLDYSSKVFSTYYGGSRASSTSAQQRILINFTPNDQWKELLWRNDPVRHKTLDVMRQQHQTLT